MSLVFTITDANSSNITVAATDMSLTVSASFTAEIPPDKKNIKHTLRNKFNNQVYLNNLAASLAALIGTQL